MKRVIFLFFFLNYFNLLSQTQTVGLFTNDSQSFKGYTLFSAKKYKRAKSYFEKIKNVKKYESDAYYYLGHISYQYEDYDSAVESFKNVSKNDQKKNLAYFQVDMNFRLGRFEKAIQLGIKELKSIKDSSLISEISKIIGESYFNLNKYKSALKYLEKYQGKNGKWSNVDYYHDDVTRI